jgi:hypothetical protein
MQKVLEGYRMPRSQGAVECPQEMYDVMLCCWNRRPERRPTFAYLRDFFNDYATKTECGCGYTQLISCYDSP